MVDLSSPHAEMNRRIRAAGREARAKLAPLKRRTDYFDRDAPERLAKTAIPDPRPFVSPEHYHLTYSCEGTEVPHFAVAFTRQREAYLEILRMAHEAGPNVEFYEDGRVMLETHLAGRTGLYRVVIGVAACLSTRCRLRGMGLILPPSALVTPGSLTS